MQESKAELPLVVFADIDGLLSSLTGVEPAAGICAIRELGSEVALVLCSGKTRPEIEHLSQEFGIAHPFICEHGAAAFVPNDYFPFDIPDAVSVAGYQVVEFGRTAASVGEVLRRTAERHGVSIRTFSEMSVEEVAQDCEVSLLQARLAKLRDYGQLFRVVDSYPEARLRFLDALRGVHLRCVQGSRYDHVGASVDTSVGVGMLRTLYRRMLGPTMTVGVADWLGEGDVLQVVECPIVVVRGRTSTASRVARRIPNLRVVPFSGGREWADGIVGAIQEAMPRWRPTLPAGRSPDG